MINVVILGAIGLLLSRLGRSSYIRCQGGDLADTNQCANSIMKKIKLATSRADTDSEAKESSFKFVLQADCAVTKVVVCFVASI